MDYGDVDGRGITAQGQVYVDGGPGDGGAPHQTPGGLDTYVGDPGILPGTTSGTHSGGYHQGYGDGGCWETLWEGRNGGGADSVSLQHWLLRFGSASAELRLIVGDFVEWIGNGRPPWSAYRALMSGRLIALDKQPGIRLVGVGETWRQMM